MLIFFEIVGGAILLAILFGPALLAGRAIAKTWKPWWHAALWMIPYAFGLRFLQYALSGHDLLSPQGYLLTLIAAMAVSVLGHRMTRTKQMTTQYPWLYERSGPLTWRRRAAVSAA